MSKISEKMLNAIQATKITETVNRFFLTAAQKTKLDSIKFGSNVYAGITGIEITHGLTLTGPYAVTITNTSQPNNLGDVWIEQKTETTFVVKNSGADTITTFDWNIIL